MSERPEGEDQRSVGGDSSDASHARRPLAQQEQALAEQKQGSHSFPREASARESTVVSTVSAADPPRKPVFLRKRPKTEREKQLRRRRLWVCLVAIPVFLLAGAFFFTRTFLEVEHLTAEVTEILGREFAVPVAISRVEYRFPNHVSAYHLSFESPEGSRFAHLVTIPKIQGRLRLFPLLFGRVEMESLQVVDAEVFIERDDNGVCTLTPAIEPSTGKERDPKDIKPGIDWSPPAVILQNVRVHSCPESVFETEEPLVIPELVLRYLDDDRTEFTLTARAADPAVATIGLDGIGNFLTGDLHSTFRIERLQVNEAFRTRLPATLREIWDEYRPSGTADLVHHLDLRGGQVQQNYALVTLEEAALDISDPPIALEGVSGKVRVSGESVQIVESLRGRAFGGEATLNGSIALSESGPGGGTLGLELTGIQLDDSVRAALPPEIQAEWDLYSPVGVADLSLTATGDTFPPELERTNLDFRNVDLSYRDVPYPLNDISGTVVVSDGTIAVDLSGGTAPACSIKGQAFVESGRPLQVEVSLTNLTIDETLRTALPDDIGEVVDEYSPGGTVDLTVLVGRIGEGEELFTNVHLRAVEATMRHQAFPLDIHSLRGDLRFSKTGIVFSDLSGMHGDAKVSLEKGDVAYGPDGHTEIEIHAPELVVDQKVVRAFPPETRESLSKFGLETPSNGKVDTRVRLTAQGYDSLEVSVRAQIRTPLKVRYREFPYPLTFVRGEVFYDSARGVIRFVDLLTSPAENPVVAVSGEQSEPDPHDPDRRLLAATLEISPGPEGRGVELGETLLRESLPADLKEFTERMGLTGGLSGKVSVRHESGGATPDVVDYEGEATLQGGAVDFGLKLYDIDTTFVVGGGLDGDHPHHFQGSLDRGSYRFSRFKIDVTRPTQFTYGEVHPEILLRTNPDRTEVAGYLPTSYFVESLTSRDVSKVFQASIGPSRIFGGELNGFFFVDLAEGGDFAGEAECEQVDLSIGGEDIFGTEDISGIAEGVLQLRGKTQDVDSMNGFGFGKIYSARLTKIPALAAIFLNPLAGLSEENLHFHKAVLERFEIRDQKILIEHLGDLRLESPVVNLHGRGSLSFESELDLLLEPQTLGGLPILSALLNTLTRFRLTGNLDDPEVFGDQGD